MRAWEGRLLNIHPSLLPAYRGLHTHRRVLEAGEPRHGCTVHFVVEELDAGPAVIQGRLAVRPGEDEAALSARVQRLEHIVYPRAVGWFAAGRLACRDGSGLDRRTPGGTRDRRGGDLKAMAIGVLAILAAAPAAADGALAPFVAEYDVRYGRMAVGTSRTELAVANGHWTLETTSTASGFARVIASGTLRQRSEFDLHGDGPRPRRYSFDDGTDRTGRDVALEFDWRAGRVRGTAEDAPVDLATVPGLQDAASMQALVLARLRAGREPGTIAMIEKDKVKYYRYTLLRRETLKTAIGEARDRRLPERPRRLGPRNADLACAEARLRRGAGRAAHRRQARLPDLHPAATRRRLSVPSQVFGSVTPFWPWYLPPRSLYEVSQTSSDSKNRNCATPSFA